MEKRQKLKAFLEEDLSDILEAIKQTDNFLEGKLRCKKCDAQIDEKNLSVILPVKNGQFEFLCDKPTCSGFFPGE